MRIFLVLFVPACLVGDVNGPDVVDNPQRPQPTTQTVVSIAGGTFKAISLYMNVEGRAQLVRTVDDKTEVSLAVTGVPASLAFTAHVHTAPCQYQGGGHYKIDPVLADTVETNELWLHGTSTAKGAVFATATFDHLARGEALSVVIHDPNGGAKLACADLLTQDVPTVELAGTFLQLPGATETISGSLGLSRTNTATTLTLDAAGFDPAATAYTAHVHTEPCEVAGSGVHYKRDPTIVDTQEANEVWIPISYATGDANTNLSVQHAVRSDAQSVVIHRTVGTTPTKVACASIIRRTEQLALVTTGTATPLKADASLTGSATLTRKLTGVTEVSVVVSGLVANTKYTAHVHDQPCWIENGGNHFKFDHAINDAVADNEIWLTLNSDRQGSTSGSTWKSKLAAADAQSFVIHAPDSSRVGCFDLR